MGGGVASPAALLPYLCMLFIYSVCSFQGEVALLAPWTCAWWSQAPYICRFLVCHGFVLSPLAFDILPFFSLVCDVRAVGCAGGGGCSRFCVPAPLSPLVTAPAELAGSLSILLRLCMDVVNLCTIAWAGIK